VEQKLRQKVGVELELNTALVRHWSRKLRSRDGDGRPLFPLAPVDLRQDGKITEEEYNQQNESYGKACSDYVVSEITRMFHQTETPPRLKGGSFTVWGIGLARDLAWIQLANEFGLTGDLYDASGVAIGNGRRRLREMQVSDRCTIWRKEIKGEDSDIPDHSTLLYLANFLQILPPEGMQAAMGTVGRYLARNQNRRVVIVHPLPEDNRGVWWGDTYPYAFMELVSPALLEYGDLAVLRIRQAKYFHHKYTLLTLGTHVDPPTSA
jgi:hypothetical protein